MGYDFHLTESGPRLIEINTNAGGALLNGLHTAALCDPGQARVALLQSAPIEEVETHIVDTFRSEFAAVRRRGRSARARGDRRRAARPSSSSSASSSSSSRSSRAMASRRGSRIHTSWCASAAGGIELDGWPIDLVYLRDTDFQLRSTRTAVLREAHLAGEVVVTPSPREHHLLADKRRLEIFSSIVRARGSRRRRPRTRASSRRWCPRPVPSPRCRSEEAWATRRDWVFKPAASFGSKAVYRGDKISKKKLAEIHADASFLAQRRVAPGTISIRTPEGDQEMKFDVRAYAYRDEIFLLGARVYEGQVTNMRSPGGGFSAICVARDGEACCPPTGESSR